MDILSRGIQSQFFSTSQASSNRLAVHEDIPEPSSKRIDSLVHENAILHRRIEGLLRDLQCRSPTKARLPASQRLRSHSATLEDAVESDIHSLIQPLQECNLNLNAGARVSSPKADETEIEIVDLTGGDGDDQDGHVLAKPAKRMRNLTPRNEWALGSEWDEDRVK